MGLTKPPSTLAGQVVNAIVSVLGVVVLAVPAGIVAAGFTEIHAEDRRKRTLAKSAVSSFKFRANASRTGREKKQSGGSAEQSSSSVPVGTGADASAGLVAMASDTSVEVQPTVHSPGTPLREAGADPVKVVPTEWMARLEDRQQRLEASMERMEAMLSSIVVATQQPRQGGERDYGSQHLNEFDARSSATSPKFEGAE